MWADGAGSLLEVHQNPRTAGTLFKQSMLALADTLQSKVRCARAAAVMAPTAN
jgi:hypothetical protein